MRIKLFWLSNIASQSKNSYEIPAGKLEIGENGSEQDAAARELEEETGYSGDLKQIHEFYTAIGFCNEKLSYIKQLICKKCQIHVRKMMTKS